MHGAQGYQSKHHFRFYVVLITLVIGAIFFLLYTNDSQGGFGITSAIVGIGSNDSAALGDDGNEEGDTFVAKVGKSSNEVDLTVHFDQIPTLRKEARVKEIELRFDDLTTKINVNNDKLELRNLQEVTLRITGFSGNLDFDRVGFSLDGTVRSLEVNDIALSSKGEIAISFDNLNYDYLRLEDIELQDVELPHGDGELTAAEKLTYALEQDTVKIYYFNGRVSIGRQNTTSLDMEGVAKGISVSGALLNLDLS